MRRSRSPARAGLIRKALKRKGAAFLLLIAALNLAKASEFYEAEGHALVVCYDAAAEYYGALTCDPPAVILGAVFGKCTREEGALRRVLASKFPDQKFLDRTIKETQTVRSQKLQSIILDARIRVGKSCP